MTFRLAIVGGGVSGLAAAHRAQELATAAGSPLEVTLLEARGRLGGAIGTIERAGYLAELGPDMFITDKPWALGLCERLGLGPRLVASNDRHRRSLVLARGRLEPVPEGFMLLSPARLRSLLTTPILSLRGRLRACAEPLVPARRGDFDESLAEFARRRLGREALERLVEPLVAGIYTGDPARLSLRATLPRFIASEREHGSLWRAEQKKRAAGGAAVHQPGTSGARYGLFVAFPGGLRELVAALEARLLERGATVELGAIAVGLARDGDGFRLTHRRGERLVAGAARAPWAAAAPRGGALVEQRFDAVVVALPAPAAAPLLAQVAPELGRELGAIRYASSAIVVSGHRFADVRHPLDAFGLVVPAVEGRQVFSVSFASRKFEGRAPEGRVLLRSFVGGIRHGALLARSDEALVALVRRELEAMLGASGEPELALVARHEEAMPQYELGHLERVARIERLLASEPRLAYASNALRGVGVPDCVGSGERASEHLLGGGPAPTPRAPRAD